MDLFFDNLTQAPAGIPLSKLTEAITNTVSNARELSGVWVTAELSDVRVAGGHCYMELIEKNDLGQTIAKLRATIWRTTFNQLRQKFISATNKDISNGIKALVRGSTTHHSIYGLSFNIYDIDPSYTIGDMERLRREILIKLSKEGLVHKNKNLPFPIAPQKLAVISAEGAAGYGDFINHLSDNSEGFVFYPVLFPCIMQGDKVSESIRKALRIIESNARFWDCVVIVRGGGATTDLNGFDEYELAKAVATCPIPVVVGIGHERDRNVLDEIAHKSLKTPTAVAGFFIDQARMAFEKVITLTDKIRVYSSDLLRGEERRLSSLQSILPQLFLRKIEESALHLNSLAGKLPIIIQGRYNQESLKIKGIQNSMLTACIGKFRQEYVRIDGVKILIKNLTENLILQGRQKITSLESMVKVLDPLNTLQRGYSITRINGKAIKSKNEVEEGAVLSTTLPDGEIRSVVIKDTEIK